jgi:molecular chaperone Hsp33
MTDTLQRFIFDNTDVRGELVVLDTSYQTAFQHIDYPEPLRYLLGEALSAAALMTATLKFTGNLSVQLQGDGILKLLLVHTNHLRQIRGLIKWNGDPGEKDFSQLIGAGQCMISIEPEDGNRYQGIVPLDGNSLAECLEHYFVQSEQLPTRMWLVADDHKAAGLLLQQLPHQHGNAEERQRDWEHLTVLAHSVQKEELLDLPKTELLYRLFHDEKTRLFETQEVEYLCTCSRDRSEKILVGLGKSEIQELMEINNQTSMNCEFCNAEYTFSRADLKQLLEIAE